MCVLASRDLKPFDLQIKGLHINYGAPCGNDLLDFVKHMKRVNDTDMAFPIILSPEGVIVDGRHRLAKALIEGRNTIKAVQLKTMPKPTIEEVD